MRKTVLLWWASKLDGGEDVPHWKIRFMDGETKNCSAVAMATSETALNPDGFLELPGGPRGIIRGELVSYEELRP